MSVPVKKFKMKYKLQLNIMNNKTTIVFICFNYL